MTIKEQVVQARLEHGYSYTQITNEFGIAKSTARGWVNSVLPDTQPNVTPYINHNIQRDKTKKFQKTEEFILEFLSQLSPIKLSNQKRNPNMRNLSKYAVVGSDFHFGCHDPKAISIFLETIDILKPSTIVLNGDTMDFLAISKYPKDIKVNWSLQTEREEYHKFLNDLVEVSGGATIFETVSNHSGQSIDGRWRRYLSDRIGELASLDNISELLSYENVFMGDFKNSIKHVDYVDLNGLIVTHGTTVRKNGGASARGEIDKWHTSILHGHTHRIGSTCQRIPSIAGRPETQLFGFEGGCMCSLDSLYASAPNWQQGFNIVSLSDDGNSFGMEQVLINNGVANISTIGCSVKA